MKKTAKITLCAMMVALVSVFMLTSYFPYLTYSIPAVAGLFIMLIVIEVNKKWALLSFLASSVLVFLIAENEAKLLYIIFFGYYPIIKSILESVKSRAVEYILKFVLFNTALILHYTVFSEIFGVSYGDMNEFGKYTVLILLFVANVIFPIYDIALSRVVGFYMVRVHPSVCKFFRL